MSRRIPKQSILTGLKPQWQSKKKEDRGSGLSLLSLELTVCVEFRNEAVLL